MGSRRGRLDSLGLAVALGFMLAGSVAAQSTSVVGSWERDLEIPGGPALIGTPSEDGTMLSGTVSQGDGSLPRELTKR